MREPQVVVTPCVLITSLIAMGTPASAGNASPFATIASTRAACANARSGESAKNAFSFGFSCAIRAKYSSANSRAEMRFSISASRIAPIVQSSNFSEFCEPVIKDFVGATFSVSCQDILYIECQDILYTFRFRFDFVSCHLARAGSPKGARSELGGVGSRHDQRLSRSPVRIDLTHVHVPITHQQFFLKALHSHGVSRESLANKPPLPRFG